MVQVMSQLSMFHSLPYSVDWLMYPMFELCPWLSTTCVLKGGREDAADVTRMHVAWTFGRLGDQDPATFTDAASFMTADVGLLVREAGLHTPSGQHTFHVHAARTITSRATHGASCARAVEHVLRCGDIQEHEGAFDDAALQRDCASHAHDRKRA